MKKLLYGVPLLASALAPPIALTGCLGPASDPPPELRVERVERASDGQPYLVRGELGQVAAPDALGAPDALAGVLPAIADTLGAPAAELRAIRSERDELGMTHVRLAQYKNGLRVVSGEAIVHLDAGGVVREVNGSIRDRELPAAPSIAAAAAERTAVAASEEAGAAVRSELTYLVSNRDGELYLAWEVAVSTGGGRIDDLVYVDALTGGIVDRHPQVFSAKDRIVRNGGGGVFPVTNAPTIGTESSPPTDAVALAAYTNIGTTYDCYKTLYNRDSYNNQGAQLAGQVHVVFDFGNGQRTPNNAVWSSQDRTMAYGDGDGAQMKPLAYGFDVTAHELTHAVTSSTANLVYQNESGALNEAMSDIMAAVCEAWKDKGVSAATWQVGEEIWTPNTPGDALRYMDSPTKDGQSPDYYPERYTGTQDNGGVHLNSGLANLSFYLVAAGGKHPRGKTATTVPGIGIDKAGAIYQRALTTKFTANTSMAQARTLLEQAAQELYPGSCARASVALAWATIGVGAAPSDAAPPKVTITSPATGAQVASGFQVQVDASDDQCIQKIELLVDGAVAQTLTSAPFTFATDAALAEGKHTVEVKAYDTLNQATANTTITVSRNGTGGVDNNGTGNHGNSGNGTATGGGGELTGGCDAGGQSGAGLLLGLALLELVLLRRR